MGRRASVLDAVTGAEVVRVGAELKVHSSFDDDEQLLGIPVRVRLVPRRPAGVELGCDDLERMERLRRQECLATEAAPDEKLPRLPPQHARTRQALGREEIRDLDPERCRQPLERGHAGARAAALELTDEAFADAGRVCDVLQRAPAQDADCPEPLPEVDRAVAGGGCPDCRRFSHLNFRFIEMKRPYGSQAWRSIESIRPSTRRDIWRS